MVVHHLQGLVGHRLQVLVVHHPVGHQHQQLVLQEWHLLRLVEQGRSFQNLN